MIDFCLLLITKEYLYRQIKETFPFIFVVLSSWAFMKWVVVAPQCVLDRETAKRKTNQECTGCESIQVHVSLHFSLICCVSRILFTQGFLKFQRFHWFRLVRVSFSTELFQVRTPIRCCSASRHDVAFIFDDSKNS